MKAARLWRVTDIHIRHFGLVAHLRNPLSASIESSFSPLHLVPTEGSVGFNPGGTKKLSYNGPSGSSSIVSKPSKAYRQLQID